MALKVILSNNINSNCMVQECYLRNKGKTTPKPKKWHEVLMIHYRYSFHHRKNQGLVKGENFCFRNLDFYFRHRESTSTASQKSKDLNKVSLLFKRPWI